MAISVEVETEENRIELQVRAPYPRPPIVLRRLALYHPGGFFNPTRTPPLMAESDDFTPLWRERIRFMGVDVLPDSDHGCAIEVELALAGGARILGESSGGSTPDEQMATAARATLDALQPVLGGRLTLELKGVRPFHAFDSMLVIVSVLARGSDERYSLIGAVAAPDEDPIRGAVLAVLDSANRIVEHFARESPAGD